MGKLKRSEVFSGGTQERANRGKCFRQVSEVRTIQRDVHLEGKLSVIMYFTRLPLAILQLASLLLLVEVKKPVSLENGNVFSKEKCKKTIWTSMLYYVKII